VGAEEVDCGFLHGGGVEGPVAVPDVGGQEWGADAVGGGGLRGGLWKPMSPGARDMGHPGGCWSGCWSAGEDAVFVGFGEGGVAGVEGFGDGFGGEDADAGWESTVEGAEKVFGGDRGFQLEGGDLRKGMDAGVGAAGALRKDGFAGQVAKRGRKGALNGREVGLDLPAVEGSAVVAEG